MYVYVRVVLELDRRLRSGSPSACCLVKFEDGRLFMGSGLRGGCILPGGLWYVNEN